MYGIFGLYRSGTNYLEYVINHNTDLDILDSHDRYINNVSYKHVASDESFRNLRGSICIWKGVEEWHNSIRATRSVTAHPISQWEDYHKYMIKNADKRNILFIKYENMLKDPRHEFNRICDAFGSSITNYHLNIPTRRMDRSGNVTGHLFIRRGISVSVEKTDTLLSIESKLDSLSGSN